MARRRRRRPAFELERFDAIAVGKGATLLHVAGRWRSKKLQRVPEPVLVAGAGPGERTLEALPDPGALPAFSDADPPPWRAGFALRGSHVAGTRYALRISDGHGLFELPEPNTTLPGSPHDAVLLERITELEAQVQGTRRRQEGESGPDANRRRIAGTASLEALRARRAALAHTERLLEQLRADISGRQLVPQARMAEIAEAAGRRAQQVGAIEARLGDLRAALARDR